MGEKRMGRLSEAINGYRGRRSVYLDSGASRTTTSGADVEVTGIIENQAMFERLMTTQPDFDKNFRAVIRKALQEARKNLSKDARSAMNEDPRKAYKAVKHTVYKELFGGNLSILQKRKGTAGPKYQLIRHRKLDDNPRQRGGNRRPVNNGTDAARLNAYFGSDRGFVLRFINAGTISRQTRFGNRGAIRQTGWFAHTAPWQMENAAEIVANAVNEYIKKQANNG